MFHGLLKAHAQEARSIVRQALDILTPVMPHRMEDGNVSEATHFLISNLQWDFTLVVSLVPLPMIRRYFRSKF